LGKRPSFARKGKDTGSGLLADRYAWIVLRCSALVFATPGSTNAV